MGSTSHLGVGGRRRAEHGQGRFALVLFTPVFFALGCGHPATREECELILSKNVEFELRSQNVSDPKVIDERVETAMKEKGELLEPCIGTRITDDAVACVRKAQTTEAFEACLN
ncbi:MAG: hypothetical protein AAGA56_13655 [Myxococcota bacterium]